MSYASVSRRFLPMIIFVALCSCSVAQAQSRGWWINDMKLIHLGLENYQGVFRRLPSDVLNTQGKPILSWRVLLLPYVEQDHLYKQFKLNEAWDSAHNLKLADKIPSVYQDFYGISGSFSTVARRFLTSASQKHWVF